MVEKSIVVTVVEGTVDGGSGGREGCCQLPAGGGAPRVIIPTT